MEDPCWNCDTKAGIDVPCASCIGVKCEKCGRTTWRKRGHVCNWKPDPAPEPKLELDVENKLLKEKLVTALKALRFYSVGETAKAAIKEIEEIK